MIFKVWYNCKKLEKWDCTGTMIKTKKGKEKQIYACSFESYQLTLSVYDCEQFPIFDQFAINPMRCFNKTKGNIVYIFDMKIAKP